MADPKKMSISYAGQARADRHQDVKTRVFDPNLVLLAYESVPDSIKHGAKNITFDFSPDPEMPSRRACLTYRDDGDGDADVTRMTSPSTENGVGVSRYGKGLSFCTNRLDDGTFPFVYEAKKKGRTVIDTMLLGPLSAEGMTIPLSLPEIGYPITCFKTKEESGFRKTIGVFYDRFQIAHMEGRKKLKKGEVAPPAPPMGDAHYWKNVRDHIEEILRVRLPSYELSEVTIRIKTKDIDGNVVETTVRKRAFIDVLRESQHVVLLKEEDRDMGKNYRAIEKYYYITRKANAEFPFDETLANEFPHYMNGMCALFANDDYIVADMRLCDAYNIPATQSTQANRLVYVNFVRKTCINPDTNEEELVNMNLIPTPATIKVGFIGPVYDEYLSVFRKNKPAELMCPKMKKKIQDGYDNDDDAKTTASSSSLESSVTLPTLPPSISGDAVPDIRVPVIPTDPAGDLDLPTWISKMIGTASNLTLAHNTATGVYTFTYKRPIHDIDKDTISLALAVNDFRRRNPVAIENIEIVWNVAASREYQVREKVREYAENEHAVLNCVRFTRA